MEIASPLSSPIIYYHPLDSNLPYTVIHQGHSKAAWICSGVIILYI